MGLVIIGGDFNIPLNPLQNTSTGTTPNAYKILKQIKLLLRSLMLVDPWRLLNPTGKDFTYYSAPHNKYSRIYYFFVTQRDLSLLKEAKIGIHSLSDHAPISIFLTY